jgi:hypothetical protein
LQHPLQIDQRSILEKGFIMVIYKVCTNIILTCTLNISKLKKVLSNFCWNNVWKSVLMSSVWTLETNTSKLNNFCKFAHL